MYDELLGKIRQLLDYKGLMPVQVIMVYKELLGEAADAIEELSKDLDSMNEANIALYGALPKWIPVTERLPEEGGWYLANVFSLGVQWGEITTKDSEWIQLVFYHEGKFHKLTGSNAKVTHWMLLPEPPTAEEVE